MVFLFRQRPAVLKIKSIRNLKTLIQFIGCFALALLVVSPISAQSKRKKKKKEPTDYATGVPYLYHNTTSKYNYFFNAREIYKESVASLENGQQDNFSQMLPLYKYSGSDGKSVEAQVDEAIKKISISVPRHRPSRWTDDSYLLLAKLDYLKKDFAASEEALDFLLAEYSPEAMKAREERARKAKGKKTKKTAPKKKGDKPVAEKPKSYFLRHKPAYEDGVLWMARTYIQQERFEDADNLLNKLQNSPTTHKNMLDDIAEVRLLGSLKAKDYAKASEQLEQVLAAKPPRKKRARYNYLLAQLYQKQAQNDKAYAAFQKVLKSGPTYDMEFNARLNMALNIWKSGKSSPEAASKTLEKMLTDAKNKDFKDQIYYTLAQIALESGKEQEAIAYFKKSLAQGSKNPTQKAEAYLQLAEYYYAQEDYVDASQYYDSTLTVLPTSDERFEAVRNTGTSLKEIADNLRILQLQDSLLSVAQLSEPEQRALALKAKKERLAKAQQNTAANTTINTAGGMISDLDAKKSSFFAYDQKSVKKGRREFEKIWGARPLADNWRRSNSSSFDPTLAGGNGNNATDSEATLTDQELAAFLKDVPKDEAATKTAHKAIEDAYFKLGNLYRDRLKNYAKSSTALETLLRRYPDSPHELEALYLLYLSNRDMGKQAQANTYAGRITQKYPDSKYAKVLKDPAYAAQLSEEDKDLAVYYDATYDLFKKGNYQNAYNRLKVANEQFGAEHAMKPKFALLAAFCVGKLNGKDEYVKALQEVSARYPETAEQQKASEILRYLNVKPGGALTTAPGSLDNNKPKSDDKSDFSVNLKEAHYFLIFIDQSAKEMNLIKQNINEYNDNKYKGLGLRASSLFLGTDNEIPLLIVRKFKDADGALDYLKEVAANSKDYLGGKYIAEMYPISQSNYRQILRQKNLNGYAKFFEENYKK